MFHEIYISKANCTGLLPVDLYAAAAAVKLSGLTRRPMKDTKLGDKRRTTRDVTDRFLIDFYNVYLYLLFLTRLVLCIGINIRFKYFLFCVKHFNLNVSHLHHPIYCMRRSCNIISK